MTEIAVLCEQVNKRYGSRLAMDGLNLSIPPGRVVGVLGPNGSGKSTLFRLLTGLTQADDGIVRVLGQQPGWHINRDIAYLPDRARWYPDHTVRKAFAWAQHLLPGFNSDTADRLAQFMNVDVDMPIGAMSRGQEARVMLILCIARQVPLVILDEPFAGIDAISRERIIDGLIDHIGDGDRTVVISTHELYETEALFDHVVFLDAGRVVLSGDAEELRRQHGSMHSIMRTLYR